MPEQLRHLIRFLSFCMVLTVTQWMPLRPTADRCDGCFCLGSGPVFGLFGAVFLFASFPLAKRKSGWGICGSSFFVLLWFLWVLPIC